MKKTYLLPLLFFLCLASCDNDKETPMPDKPDQEAEAKEVSFSYSYSPPRYDPFSEKATEFELIVSQKDGKVLLDTLLVADTKHNLVVSSEEDKFDITTVYLEPATLEYIIQTYIQVNPDNWRYGYKDYQEPPASEQTKIYYTNVPTSTTSDFNPGTDIKFSGKNRTGYGSHWDNKGNLTISFRRSLPTDTAYLLLTSLGKYLFAELTPGETRVDFAEAKTAVKHLFNLPAGVSKPYSSLSGYFKKGKYNQQMQLYFGSGGDDYHLQYPTSGIEEFNLSVSYVDAEGYSHGYFHIGESIPTEMGFLSETDFTVTKPEFNDFQIKFAEGKPTSYRMGWSNEKRKVYWRVNLSPEVSAIKLLDYLKGLHVRYLEGMDLSGFSLKDVLTYKANGYTHQSLHSYLNDPDAVQRNEQRQYSTVYKQYK